MQKIPLLNLSKKRSFSCFQNTEEKKHPSMSPYKPPQIKVKRSRSRQFISESEDRLHLDDSFIIRSRTPANLPLLCETEFWKPPVTSQNPEKKNPRKLAPGESIISQFMRRPRSRTEICPCMCATQSKSSLSFLLGESIFNSKLYQTKRLGMTQIPGFVFGNLTARRKKAIHNSHEQKFQNLTFVIKEKLSQFQKQCSTVQIVANSRISRSDFLEIIQHSDFHFTSKCPRYLAFILSDRLKLNSI